MRSRSLYEPRPVAVGLHREAAHGAAVVAAVVARPKARRPATVAGVPVAAVREEWLVEDRWWTGQPLRRRYLELVLADGRCAVCFCDLLTGLWFEQR